MVCDGTSDVLAFEEVSTFLRACYARPEEQLGLDEGRGLLKRLDAENLMSDVVLAMPAVVGAVPVLTGLWSSATYLRACYAMSDTDVAYGATGVAAAKTLPKVL
eukprot:3362497-Rhodomonas_salina.1